MSFWQLALAAISAVFSTCAILSLLPGRGRSAPPPSSLSGFLLAGRNLGRLPVLSLLMSSSFGINALFYQVWLGYAVGAWGLVAQSAWAASYLLLARHTSAIRQHKSLHHFLWAYFGAPTRVLAALCSILGMMYLIGWEASIARSTLEGTIQASGAVAADELADASSWLLTAIVGGTVLFTLLGGLRGNAIADTILNVLKTVIVLALIWLLATRVAAPSSSEVLHALFPSVDTMVQNLGIVGLVTNIVFSAAWQFVDASTWQSVIAGREESDGDSKRILLASGVVVFIAPGILGTLIGVLLAGVAGVTEDSIMTHVVGEAANAGWVLIMCIVLVAACAMSLMDGLFLAVSYTVGVDLLQPKKGLDAIEADRDVSTLHLKVVKAGVALTAVLSVWGIQTLFEAFDIELFEFLYIVIVAQLSLLGPVLAGLAGRTPRGGVSAVIPVAFLSGVACAYAGTAIGSAWLVQSAGTITALVSVLTAWRLTARFSSSHERDSRTV